MNEFPGVGGSPYPAKECTVNSLWVFHRPVLPNFSFLSRVPQTGRSAVAMLHHSEGKDTILGFSSGLEPSRNLGLGQNGVNKTHYTLPRRFWHSQVWYIKTEVRAQMQKRQTTEAGARGISSCRCWLHLGPARSLLRRIFPGCGELFSGLCISPPYAKIMNNTEGQELEIYWLGTEVGST